jgi:putative nucleotidyltransferase with HDIG domain
LFYKKDPMTSRDEAWALVQSRLTTEHLRSHVLATEACMRSLAQRLGQDQDLWGVTGLVHDIDLDEVDADPARHGVVGAAWLAEAGYPPALVQAVLVHAGHASAETDLDKALVAVDPTTGFIVAATLVRPDRSLHALEPRSVRKRMKEKRFAANVDRDQIRSIEKLGMPTEEFLVLCIEAMRSIADRLGLAGE